jgi:hypothetical protein
MGGGIDLNLAELISMWRSSHQDATLDDVMDFLTRFFSSHRYQILELPESFLDKPLTSYIIKKKKHVSH